ncbi:acyl-CoA dehydrogenase family protein [Streptomyces sp. NPDC003660]
MSVPPTTPPPALAPQLTSDHTRLWAEAAAFAANEVAPRVERMEAAPGRVERRIANLMAQKRWFAVTVPQRLGGLGAGHVAKTVLIHRISCVSAAAGAILQATLIPVGALLHFATWEQKQCWLPQVANGSTLLTIASTEPEAGGHIGGIETTAERDGHDWVITGIKAHVGNSHLAGAHIVLARTASQGAATRQALTAFLVESDRKGLSLGPHRPGLGLHGFSFGRLHLDRVRVPAENIIGEIGQGADVGQCSSILYGRANLAALSLGLHEALVATTKHFVNSRSRYAGHLSDLPVVRHRIGEMEGRLRTARSLAYEAVRLLDHGHPCDPELINAKHQGHQLASESAKDAMELHGANGLKNPVMGRLWRDGPHTYAPAGTGEVQRLRLADAALNQEPISWSERLAAETSWARADPAPA